MAVILSRQGADDADANASSRPVLIDRLQPSNRLAKPLNEPIERSGSLILVVDDQPDNLKLLRQILAQTPYQLTFASGGRQALDRIKSTVPDLILLDLMMPDIDGLTVCQVLQQDAGTAEIPIIFLTASQDTEHLLEAFEYGAVDYITKPVNASELLARVRAHLSLKETRSALDSLNQHLESEVERRTVALQKALAFTQVSQKITQTIRSTLDETRIFDAVVRELAVALDLSRCHIGLYDESRSASTIAHEYVDSLPSSLGKTFPFSRFSDIYPSLRQGHSVKRQLLADELHALPETAIFLACTLRDHQHVIGDIWLYRLGSRDFSADEMHLVEQVADQTAIAIRQAWLYQGAQTQVQELERLNHAKDDFLKTISHELRTPLTTVKTAADTIQTLLTQPDWQSQYQQIATRLLPLLLEGCDSEIKLVNTLLEFVHLDVKPENMFLDEISIDELIEFVVPACERHCRQQGLLFELAIAPDLPMLQTNADMLTRVVAELLDNACKYTPAGGTIELAAVHENSHFQIRVCNSGIAIAENELNHIFDKFYRLPQHDRWQYGGVGLGLALVKKQVEYLGGRVNATLLPPTLTISIELPFHSAGEQAA